MILALLVSAALLLALLVASGRLPRIEAEHAVALRILRDDGPPLGASDAFAALWTARHGIDEERIDEATAAATAAWWNHARGGPRPPRGLLDAYPSILPPRPLRDLPCPAADQDCLPIVRADRETVRRHLAAWEPFRVQNLRLRQHDHVRDAMPPLPWAPTPPLMDLLRPEINRAALLHVDGDSAAALASLCDFAATWRRLGTHSDSLLIHVVAMGYLSEALRLHAEMTSEVGPGLVQPALCGSALAPLADAEFDLCPLMRREFRAAKALLDAAQREEGERDVRDGPLRRILLNREHLLALSSVPLAWYCADAHRSFVQARKPLPRHLPPRPRCSRLASWLNPLGCRLAPISKIRHRSHYHRLLDVDALLRAAELARWLAQAQDPEAAFTDRPQRWLLPHHDLLLDLTAGTLRLRPIGRGTEMVIRFRPPEPSG